ncbi:enoyl-CoA hydratase-related protein [Halovivax sp.]|uniref:enoyl-CoA hydratase/isomerase family protein n=1 Tax=Halovivax sp. TaxID=1935978 RepID=UPI0025BE5962|nr:enoyl-CoA hydratase-related protein [Halovivax sp.]
MTDAETLGNDDLSVSVSDDELVIEATIDRPERRNALGEDVMAGLHAVLAAADDGPARVIVIRGAGGTFCSGGDLSEFPIGQGAQAYREGFGALAGLIRRMQETSSLTVAAVDGPCLAGGLGLAASCEFVVASEDATFGTPEVDVGLFPAQALAPIMRTVTEKAGLKLLFTGERIDAARAREIGLVTDVHPPEAFEDAVEALVDELATNSPVLIGMGKEAYYAQRGMDFEAALSYLKEMIALIAMSEDTEEGIDAFLTDREPEWRGR